MFRFFSCFITRVERIRLKPLNFGNHSRKKMGVGEGGGGGGGVNDRCESEHHSVKVIPDFVFLKSFFGFVLFRF